jgi:hypothetical protein
MIADKKLWLIPIACLSLSFLIEFMAGKVSFLTLSVAMYCFYVSLGIAGLLILLELITYVRQFVQETFPSKPKLVKPPKIKPMEEQNGTTRPEQERIRTERTSSGNTSEQE